MGGFYYGTYAHNTSAAFPGDFTGAFGLYQTLSDVGGVGLQLAR